MKTVHNNQFPQCCGRQLVNN